MFPLAVISDIHGNRWALEAVLEDIQKNWISDIVNLGDLFYSPLDPAGTADLLMQFAIPTVKGNEDRMLLEVEKHSSRTLHFTHQQLTDEHLNWLKEIPPELDLGDIFLCHGIPSRDSVYLLHDVFEDGLKDASEESIIAKLGNCSSSLILCGHDHIQNMKKLEDKRTIVNPGSVGWQAFDDDKPFDHIIETNSPEARYAIVYYDGNEFQTEFRRVDYDWKSAARIAEKNGFPDWAHWIKTGKAN